MLSKQHGCQLLQEQPLVHDELEQELELVRELPPLESVREQELQQQRELVQVLELTPLESVQVLELPPLEPVPEQELQQQREQVQELEQLVLVRDHHGQPANQLHEHRLQQECHRDKLFSASSVCSVR